MEEHTGQCLACSKCFRDNIHFIGVCACVWYVYIFEYLHVCNIYESLNLPSETLKRHMYHI